MWLRILSAETNAKQYLNRQDGTEFQELSNSLFGFVNIQQNDRNHFETLKNTYF